MLKSLLRLTQLIEFAKAHCRSITLIYKVKRVIVLFILAQSFIIFLSLPDFVKRIDLLRLLESDIKEFQSAFHNLR